MTSQGKNFIVFCLLCFVLTTGVKAQQSVPSAEQQIEAAVMTAPKALQQGAKVYGYDQQGKWTTLREGENAIICIADNPAQSNFHVACYHKSLEPFMKYGREMRRKGLTREEVDQKRREAIDAGTFSMPSQAATLYSLSGGEEAYNFESGTLNEARSLTVVYVPYGTQETTGMTTSPTEPDGPWLMEPGTPWAHIMIPGASKGESNKAESKK